MQKLSSTQIGAVAENLVASVLMIESRGRLSAFHPAADDDGIDLLIYDKESGTALPIQVKSRSVTLKRSRTKERGDTAHFQFRRSNFNLERLAAAVFILTKEDGYGKRCGWVVPMAQIPKIARKSVKTFVIRANSSERSKDKYVKYRCRDEASLRARIQEMLKPRMKRRARVAPTGRR
jgi:hypothetical protein